MLKEADRVCIMCNGSLEEMGDQADESEEVDVIAREFVIRKHVRQKYRCKCGECIETAPAPRRLVPGGRYSLAFAIAVAVSKYADHLPLERQVKIMRREGLVVDSQTLYDQSKRSRACSGLPTTASVRSSSTSQSSSSTRRRGRLGKGAETARWHAWAVATPKGAYYEIHDTRGLEAGKSLLAGFKGIAVTDGYGVYDALEKRMSGLRLAQCWAHIQRKFVDCESAFPKETEEILALIRELYAIDGRAPPGREGDAERRQLRTTESRCVLARASRRGASASRARQAAGSRRPSSTCRAAGQGHALPRAPRRAARQQRRRARHPRTGRRSQESLRLALATSGTR